MKMHLRHLLWILIASCFSITPKVSSKDIIPTPKDTPVLGEFEPVLIDAMLKTVNLDATLDDAMRSEAMKQQVRKHGLQLFGGPMLGKVTDTSASIWVRTDHEAEVQIILSQNADL
jgi:alkaline phosphatase D